MIWKVAYLTVFLGGLVLAVHSMLHGAERWRRRHSGKPSPVLNPPTVAAMLVALGSCGYLLVARSGLGPVAILAIAILTAGAVFSGMTVLMAKWALRTPDGALPSDHEDVHGQVATVSRTITPYETGEITYVAWDATHVLPATSLDGTMIPEGAEVVIDTMENGTARVELWSIVEQRL